MPGSQSGRSGGAAAARTADPFTSSGGYVPPSSNTSHVPSTHFPQTTSLLFEACNKTGIISKFKESNQLVDEQVRLNDTEMKDLIAGVFFSEDASDIQPSSLGPLEKALQWSPERVWPSLDLLRLCLRSRKVQEVWVAGSKGGNILALLTTLLEPPSTTATQLLALRLISRTFSINIILIL